MDLFQCPLPDALVDIPPVDCPIKFDQLQKFAFQRLQTTPSFTPESILLKATWDALIAASDDTKVVVTPYLNSVLLPAGEILTEGGNDNTTLNGIPTLRGLGFVNVTAQLRNVKSEVAEALRALTPESSQNGSTNVWVYFFNRFRKIFGSEETVESVLYVKGFPIYNFYVSDVSSEGFGKDNIYNVQFAMEGGWSEFWQQYSPTDFNPLALVADTGS